MLPAFLISLLTPIAPVSATTNSVKNLVNVPSSKSTLTSQVAQAANQRQIILEPQEMRPLNGSLDNVPMFNSNSPEIVQTEGILLSAFPPQGMASPQAHLNFPMEGRFDLFTHHISKAPPPEDLRTLYIGAIAYNPTDQPITIDVLQAASYLSQPDSPFYEAPSFSLNNDGTVYRGPGDRAMLDILRGRRQDIFPAQIVIPPKQSRMLLNVPIPVKELEPPLNGRSGLSRMRSNGKVYVATLSLYARLNDDGSERAPTLEEWENILKTGQLAKPRDVVPTPPDLTEGRFEYSRVAGIQIGSQWFGHLTDRDRNDELNIPKSGESYSYGLSLLQYGTMGTGQVQTAPLVVRYPDTAYSAHGNYGVQYNLTMPLHNPTDQTQTVVLTFQNPIKYDKPVGGLQFFEPLPEDVFFRGSVRVRFRDDQGLAQTRYVHLMMRRGERGQPLVTLNMPPSDRRVVQFDFLYPADATPPQVLTVTTK
ncbi:DUF3370 domain-containing protein [Pseudanabaena mucicola]|uniref:DUF3370 domain-containing protein n=1 Tax=Pseudanabaena mucicola FACHB-723 TaxID=2692860 RepID=A0ABR7ZSZ8_9CYAN|nr:DUF3370 domain-containing protein [Pseudanabaena mucicola]MBD2187056.1 DUF3370 domain-containing protein [Pseudanabaena mucicola FACHB-723]